MKSHIILWSMTLICLLMGMPCAVSLATTVPADMPPPPMDMGNGMMPPPPPPGEGRHGPVTLKGKYVLDSGTKQLSNKTMSSHEGDTSAIWVKDAGNLIAENLNVETSGQTSSQEGSSFQGLNAAILASDGGKIALQKILVVTSGSGANGMFATGNDSFIQATDIKIQVKRGGGHGVMVSYGGAMKLKQCDILTTDVHGAAIATDRGGGTITSEKCKLVTTGQASPALYSTGSLIGNELYGEAKASEAIVIEGQNEVILENSTMIGSLNGAMLYQSFSGDAQGLGAVMVMKGGHFAAKKGALIYVTNNKADVVLDKVSVQASSGILAKAASDRWGRSGQNGGHLTLHAVNEAMSGEIVADDGSSILAELTQKTIWQGNATNVSLSLDAQSQWIVTGDSSLNDLTLLDGASLKNIKDNGYTVTYNPALKSNVWLNGKSYPLHDGGKLMPRS